MISAAYHSNSKPPTPGLQTHTLILSLFPSFQFHETLFAKHYTQQSDIGTALQNGRHMYQFQRRALVVMLICCCVKSDAGYNHAVFFYASYTKSHF